MKKKKRDEHSHHWVVKSKKQTFKILYVIGDTKTPNRFKMKSQQPIFYLVYIAHASKVFIYISKLF